MIRSALVTALATLVWASTATAQTADFRWKAEIYSDLRVEATEEMAFERSESGASVEVTGQYGPNILGKGHLELVFIERGTADTFDGLSSRQAIDPFRFESDALFVTFMDAGLDGLDISLGRKVLIWGTADKFHPTANLNALDVEDSLAFGDSIANEMIHIRYSPYFSFGDEDDPWFDEFFLEAAFVPFFKPAQLPGSARKAFTDVNEQIRLATTDNIAALAAQQKAYLAGGATIAYDVSIVKPEAAMENTMVGARMGWKLLGVDMSVSYFRGFDDIPRAETAVVTGDSSDVLTTLDLSFPKMQVLGIDMATSLDYLDGLGLWTEVAVVFHDDLYIIIDGTEFAGNATGDTFPNGPELEHEKGAFVKATVGMDYTPFPWWYINVQYLHGFVDEFGEKNLDDYMVAGMDFKFLRDTLVLRTFGVVNLQDASWILFPQIIGKPFDGGEITLGAFLYGAQFTGDTSTKFGSPVAGTSTVFLKGRILF
ncbi:MAG: hypothetical protein IV100_07785 [Myxococcales bacterium]|nr:hypothetical protein [Myxococcales bacterium]